tara:strand:- start:425 stop:715 length:291 start_codon:yes stop_codon:yes gene_type:complete
MDELVSVTARLPGRKRSKQRCMSRISKYGCQLKFQGSIKYCCKTKIALLLSVVKRESEFFGEFFFHVWHFHKLLEAEFSEMIVANFISEKKSPCVK